jgi:polyhydroxyalkanoate synthesis regulator phasin
MATRKVSEPVQDAVKAYFELALGLTEASKKKAEKTVKKLANELMGKGGATASQLQGMAEELVTTSAANREAVTRLVRVEMDRALSRVGLATADEVATLTARLEALERQQHDAKAQAEPLLAPATDSVTKPQAEMAPVKKAVAKKTVAKKTAGEKTAPAKAAPEKAVKKAAADKSTVPTAAKKAPAKKAIKKAAS